MPHHSGGGSHSHGSHHSSSHRSSSHRSSSHRSSSHHHYHKNNHTNYSDTPRASSRPSRNSTRYMYQTRTGRTKYAYLSSPPRPMSVSSFVMLMIFMIPFVAAGLFIPSLITAKPRPLTPMYKTPSSHIEDNIKAIENKESLEQELIRFENTTGICPYIVTVYDDDWQGKYAALENFSYSFYVNKFSDEQHFVIAYSEPRNPSGFVDWKWEGMQGDSTDNILSKSNFEKFQKDLQKYLTDDSIKTGEAFRKTFENSQEYIMERKLDSETLPILIIFVVFWDGIVLLVLCTTIKNFTASRRNYIAAPEDNYGQMGYSNDRNYMNNYDNVYNNTRNYNSSFAGNEQNMQRNFNANNYNGSYERNYNANYGVGNQNEYDRVYSANFGNDSGANNNSFGSSRNSSGFRRNTNAGYGMADINSDEYNRIYNENFGNGNNGYNGPEIK